MQAAWNKANLDAQQTAIKIERQAASNLAAKQKELQREKENTKLAVTSAATELDRMRQTIASLKHKLPATASGASASNEALARSWDVLESCSKEYTEVSKVADDQRDELAEWQAYGQVIIDFRSELTKQ